jgi:hypothetical protein
MDFAPLAHGTGHWLVDIGIYLGPFISIIAVVLFTDRRRRKQEAKEEAAKVASVDGATPQQS